MKRTLVSATLVSVLVAAPLVTLDAVASAKAIPCSNMKSAVVSKSCAATRFESAQRTTGAAWRASIPLLSAMNTTVTAAQISAVVQPQLNISSKTDARLLAMRWPSAFIKRAVAQFVASDRLTQAAVKSLIAQ